MAMAIKYYIGFEYIGMHIFTPEAGGEKIVRSFASDQTDIFVCSFIHFKPKSDTQNDPFALCTLPFSPSSSHFFYIFFVIFTATP